MLEAAAWMPSFIRISSPGRGTVFTAGHQTVPGTVSVSALRAEVLDCLQRKCGRVLRVCVGLSRFTTVRFCAGRNALDLLCTTVPDFPALSLEPWEHAQPLASSTLSVTGSKGREINGAKSTLVP